MLLAESTRLLSFYFLLLIKGKLGERRGTSFDRTHLRFARQVLQFRNSIHDKKVTSLMSKKFASAWKAQNAAVNSARTHKHSLTCLITSYPHPKQFAVRALKRYSDKQHFSSNRFQSGFTLRKCLYLTTTQFRVTSQIKRSTVARQKAESLNSSTHLQQLESYRSGWSLFALFFSSCGVQRVRC